MAYKAIDYSEDVELPDDIASTTAHQPRFRPLWTRRKVLVGFILFFIAVIASLEIILRLSDANQGLSTVKASQHYFWVYGPTAIFTIILALWARVDYRLRQMTPWLELERTSQDHIDASIWKDYITPTMPEILWHSVRQRDFAVSAATLVVASTALSMIISTGLLVLEPLPTQFQNIPYQITSRFSQINFADLAKTPLVVDVMDALDAQTLTYPFGVTPNTAYSTFDLQNEDDVSEISQSVITDLILTSSNCTSFDLEIDYWNASWNKNLCGPDNAVVSEDYDYNLVVGNCSSFLQLPEVYNDEGSDRYFGWFKQSWCNDGPDPNKDYHDPIVFILGQVRPSGTVGPPPQTSPCANMTLPNATISIVQSKQYICYPSVTHTMANITLNMTELNSGGLPKIDILPQKPLPYTLSQEAFHGPPDDQNQVALADVLSVFWIQTSYNLAEQQNLSIGGQQVLSVYPEELVRVLRPLNNTTIQDALTSEILLDPVSKYIERTISLSAHYGMRVQHTETVNGTISMNENRLIVQPLPVRLMQALSCAIILFLIFIIFFHASQSLRTDPGLLAGCLIVYNQHDRFHGYFSSTSALDDNSLKVINRQKKDTYSATVHMLLEDQSNIEQPKRRSTNPLPKKLDVQSSKWWRPVVMTKRARTCIAVLICLTITTLEILLFLSNRSHGLADVPVSGSLHLLWSVIPAIYMVLIAMYFRALSSQYKVFAPYIQLRKLTTAKVLFRNYSSNTEPEAFFFSAFDANWDTALVCLSVFFSAFLTVITSGIWTFDLIPAEQSAIAPISTWFSSSTNDNGTTDKNAWTSGLILNSNISYPPWTYQDLVFPSMDIQAKSQIDLIRADVPAIRAALNCSIYTETELLVTYCSTAHMHYHDGPDYYVMCLDLPGPESCREPDAVSKITVAQPGEEGGEWASFRENLKEGCPQINFYWGWQDVKHSGDVNISTYPATYVRVLSCNDAIERVGTETSLRLPDFMVDGTNPPKIVSEAEVFSAARIPTSYDHLPQLWNGTMGTSMSGLWSMMATRYGIAPTDLKSPESIDKIVNDLNSAHGIIRAQQYHAALRQDAATLDNSPKTANVTLIRSNRWRLVQNATSTHALCAVMAAMLICLITASQLSSANYVLPKNPGSIAAQFSLIADSNILEDETIMREIEHALQDRGALACLTKWRFKMGWFDSESHGGRVWTINAVEHVESPMEH